MQFCNLLIVKLRLFLLSIFFQILFLIIEIFYINIHLPITPFRSTIIQVAFKCSFGRLPQLDVDLPLCH